MECEKTLLPTDQCAHCTQSDTGLHPVIRALALLTNPYANAYDWHEAIDILRDYGRDDLLEQFLPNKPRFEEDDSLADRIQESLKGQGAHWRFWAKKGQHVFPARPSDLDEDE